MGMGYAGSSLTTLDESVIKHKCPKLLKEFKEVVQRYGQGPVSDVVDGQSNVDEDAEHEILFAHAALVDTFKKKTGLEVSYFYHDVDNDGDRYDDVGECWIVSNAYQITKVAKPFEKNIRRVNFVQWG